jgi:hypothetical protein
MSFVHPRCSVDHQDPLNYKEPSAGQHLLPYRLSRANRSRMARPRLLVGPIVDLAFNLSEIKLLYGGENARRVLLPELNVLIHGAFDHQTPT